MLKDGQYTPHFSFDLWAFGQLLYQLLGGSMPQEHDDAISSGDQAQELAYLATLPTALVPYRDQVNASVPHDFC